MPVMVLYKDKKIPLTIADDIATKTAKITHELAVDSAIEVRTLEPASTFNANEIHLEMAFRDFGDWSDEQLADYHEKVMSIIGAILKRHKLEAAFSFYILPTQPPRSIWAQSSTKKSGENQWWA